MTINKLIDFVTELHADPSQSIVYCHGCFDLLHPGHIRHLKEAAYFGTALVVTVTPDRFVNKGSNRPLMPAADRVEMVRAIRWVWAAAINEWPTAVETIRLLRPHVYIKGYEYSGNRTPQLIAEVEALDAVGGKLEFTGPSDYSTTAIVNLIKAM